MKQSEWTPGLAAVFADEVAKALDSAKRVAMLKQRG